MKKKMIALLAGALMMISAGSAFAAFSGTDELYMAAYDATANKEVVIDLGSLVMGTGGQYSLTSSGVNSFNLGTNMAGATAANTMVAFFGQDLGNNNLFASASATSTPKNAASTYASFNAHIAALQTQYAGTSALGAGTATASGSYNTQMNSSGAGQFGGFNPNTFVTPEVSLASLASGGTLGIFSFGPITQKKAISATGVLQFTETLVADANGNYTVTAQGPATPIPAAFYLLGSGLMGLVGLRRKFQG